MNIGKRIIELREERNWTSLDLAEHSKVSQSTISKIENGKTSPRLDSLVKIANAFHMPLVDLLPLEAHIGKQSHVEKEIIDLLYKLTPEERKKLLDLLRVFVKRERS